MQSRNLILRALSARGGTEISHVSLGKQDDQSAITIVVVITCGISRYIF